MTWLLLLLGPLNMARGQRWLGEDSTKILFTVIANALITTVAYFATLPLWQVIYVGFVTMFGLLLWRQWAGMDFACIHGREPVRGKAKFADVVADIFEPAPNSIKRNRRWGTFWMTARGLYAWPMFLLLGVVNPLAPLYGLLMALQGPIYAAARYHKSEPVWLAEGVTGLLLGFLLMLVVR